MNPSDEQRGRDIDRLLASADNSRLRALLMAAASAPSEAGPQPGELEALAAYRELVAPPAGVTPLAARRRMRLAVVAASSAFVVISGGVAAAATGALPDPAQKIAKTMLNVVGVHVPGPATPVVTPGTGTPASPADTSGRPGASPSHPAHPTHPAHPSTSPEPGTHPTHPAHPSHPASPTATPGNSGPSRHHGNPTPSATTHPTPGHGKPTARPTTSHGHTSHPSPQATQKPHAL